MIQNVSQQRSDFQNRVDGIKKYMEMRDVGAEVSLLQWFLFMRYLKKVICEQNYTRITYKPFQVKNPNKQNFNNFS
jgi:hypothetical protein